jgi:hypothetical protein
LPDGRPKGVALAFDSLTLAERDPENGKMAKSIACGFAASPMLDEIRQYIKDNYTDEGLSVSLAMVFYVSNTKGYEGVVCLFIGFTLYDPGPGQPAFDNPPGLGLSTRRLRVFQYNAAGLKNAPYGGAYDRKPFQLIRAAVKEPNSCVIMDTKDATAQSMKDQLGIS